MSNDLFEALDSFNHNHIRLMQRAAAELHSRVRHFTPAWRENIEFSRAGICGMLEDLTYEVWRDDTATYEGFDCEEILYVFFNFWPESTGDMAFPVPNPNPYAHLRDDNVSVRRRGVWCPHAHAFLKHNGVDMWVGVYGMSRRRLLAFIDDNLTTYVAQL